MTVTATAQKTHDTITVSDGTRDLLQGLGQPDGRSCSATGWPLERGRLGRPDGVSGSRAGYRCIAHDRRGHGRSSQPWNGNEMDTRADDLAALRQRRWISTTRSTSATRPAAERSRVTSAATARRASRERC